MLILNAVGLQIRPSGHSYYIYINNMYNQYKEDEK